MKNNSNCGSSGIEKILRTQETLADLFRLLEASGIHTPLTHSLLERVLSEFPCPSTTRSCRRNYLYIFTASKFSQAIKRVEELESVEKIIIISQESLGHFINDICPGAYRSMTKVNFTALDHLTVNPMS